MKRTNAFLERMAVVIHIVYGQPARAESELGTVGDQKSYKHDTGNMLVARAGNNDRSIV